MIMESTFRYKKTDITGLRFGRITVIGLASRTARQKGTILHWNCLCDCGKTTVVKSQALHDGRTRSCGCLRDEVMKHAWDKRKDYGEAQQNQTFIKYRLSAKNRGLSFELTKEQLLELTALDCHYCGNKPSNIRKGPRGSHVYNGLDRKDNENGYTLDNVVPCCGICNRMKLTLGYEDFIEQAKRITEFQRRSMVQ